jgi:hypothetical protein
MNANTTEGKPARRAPENVRAEQRREWAELLLRWAWFVFDVVKWASG